MRRIRSALVPLIRRQDRDVDVAAELARRAVGLGADLGDVCGADDHQIDVLGERAGFAVVAASLGAVDQGAVEAGQPAKLCLEHGLRTDGLQQDRVQFIEDRGRRIRPDNSSTAP